MAPAQSRLTRSDKEFSPFILMAEDVVAEAVNALDLLERSICEQLPSDEEQAAEETAANINAPHRPTPDITP
ncbi:hypothetical protein V5O48_014731 [Marasmius crinis-equi]|uniref:Uncharacterized protein n=1 Tax=Marasmius crinis-equi TaxID=585013 RepID=A0ABR3EWG4_9AGAR